MSPASSPPRIRSGLYEITDCVSGHYLHTISTSAYNQFCDGALILQENLTPLGKWEIASVGDGFTIKQVASGLYCSLVDGEQLLSQTVVLSSTPTVWSITYEDVPLRTVRITWSTTDLCWDTPPSGRGRLISLGKISSEKSEKLSLHMKWCLRPASEDISGAVPPGIYALQNKASGTYVSLAPNERDVCCYPENDLGKAEVKQWEILPLGAGYTIRLVGTDQYCTLQDSISNGGKISLSNLPTAWKVVATRSPLNAVKGAQVVQIFWASTQFCWELHNGQATSGNQ
ncbi:hypothetical protein PHLGIDRAFT_151139 [Phlebiopsis gigantea 11061_1 CR5-6]|uniref:Ricin B lectin domain-containing protein n=1 Tax=Phlebiopsis gigantea (strain 11061_1 CR5-6) TaxID=745531 RepID=A0A0C3NKE0_PHLG1|nr:hypothetical protein PHLGIDRAFT_151139 [Phlebiopsis gigantea 11061_1 CR5-6]